MGLTSFQVCMDTPDWLEGVVNEEREMDSSPPSEDMITCSRPMIERRLRPQHDQALKCPRCDSTHTKFCYYNNYSLSQPRYFCKTCRRYWTKGGSLRNIPVGGGCRKNKKVATKKSNDQTLNPQNPNFSSCDATDLHLSFPEVQFSHLTTLLGTHENIGNSLNLMGNYNFNAVMENPRPIDFMETKFDAILGNPRSLDFMGNSGLGFMGGLGDTSNGFTHSNFHGFCSPFGISFDGNNETLVENPHKLMLPYEAGSHEDPNVKEMKPNNKLLALEWHDQGCSDVGKDSFGYFNCAGLCNGVMNNYGSSATNPLV